MKIIRAIILGLAGLLLVACVGHTDQDITRLGELGAIRVEREWTDAEAIEAASLTAKGVGTDFDLTRLLELLLTAGATLGATRVWRGSVNNRKGSTT